MPTKHGVYTTQAATGVSTPSVADSGIPFVVGAAPVQSADNYSAAALGLPVLCTSFAEAKAALGYSDDFASYDLCEVMYATVGTHPAAAVQGSILDGVLMTDTASGSAGFEATPCGLEPGSLF